MVVDALQLFREFSLKAGESLSRRLNTLGQGDLVSVQLQLRLFEVSPKLIVHLNPRLHITLYDKQPLVEPLIVRCNRFVDSLEL